MAVPGLVLKSHQSPLWKPLPWNSWPPNPFTSLALLLLSQMQSPSVSFPVNLLYEVCCALKLCGIPQLPVARKPFLLRAVTLPLGKFSSQSCNTYKKTRQNKTNKTHIEIAQFLKQYFQSTVHNSCLKPLAQGLRKGHSDGRGVINVLWGQGVPAQPAPLSAGLPLQSAVSLLFFGFTVEKEIHIFVCFLFSTRESDLI